MVRSPTPEQLAEIVDAAQYVVRTAVETFCVAGQPELPGFPDISRSTEVLMGIARLERVLNPSRIPFGSNGRKVVCVSHWPDVQKVARALRWLGDLVDLILTTWKFEPLCGADGYMLLTEGSEFTGELRPGIALIRTPKKWLPKIDRDVLEGMQTAATWITDVINAPTTPKAAKSLPPPSGEKGATGDGTTDLSPTRHSPDFRSVHWYGDDYVFTGNQAAVVKILWEAWENGTPEVSDAHLLTKAESDSKRLADVFRDAKNGKQQDAWDKMIVPGTTKGTRRLNSSQEHKFDQKST